MKRTTLLIMLILLLIPFSYASWWNQPPALSFGQEPGCQSCGQNSFETGDEECDCPSMEECKDIYTNSTASVRYPTNAIVIDTDSCAGDNRVREVYVDCDLMDEVYDKVITCPRGFVCKTGRCIHRSGTSIGPARKVNFDNTGKLVSVNYITINNFTIDYVKDLFFANYKNTVESAFLIETERKRFYDVRNMTFGNNKTIHANSFKYKNKYFYNAKNLIFDKQGDFSSGDSITYNNNTFFSFKKMEVSYDGTVTVDEVGSAHLINPNTGLVSIIENASSMKVYSNGDYHIESAQLVSYGDIILVNVTDVSVHNFIIDAKHVDSAVVNRTVLGNVETLHIEGDDFSFESAEIVMLKENTFKNVTDGSFTVSEDSISIEVTSNLDGNTFNLINPFGEDSESIDVFADSNGTVKADFIRDLSNKTVTSVNVDDDVSISINQGDYPSLSFDLFTNESTLIKNDEDPSTYYLTNGTITFDNEYFTESIISNNTASVEVSDNGFTCMSILPIGVYYYIDKRDKRRDFAISIPDYGFLHKLCIRRTPEQDFDLECTNCGVVDFVDNKITLKGIASYLRYGLMQENLAILNLNNVYTGLTDPKTTITYDNDLVYIDNLLMDIYSLDSTASLTVPSNYYIIIETPVDDVMHRLVKVNTYFGKDEITDNIIKNYQDLTITDNTLEYNNIKILPPENPLISSILE